jgi:hypothetical protein
MAISISIKSNLKDVTKRLGADAGKQIDFAAAIALTALAKEVAAMESENFAETFKSPRPFTVKSLGVKAARKNDLASRVYVKPIAAKYLDPYETGGVHVLPGRALLNPKNIRLDKYGQLPRATLAKLKARPDVFIGPVKTKAGIVNGVWQRPFHRSNTKIRGTSAKRGAMPRMANKTGKLVLLIRFGDAEPVNKQLNYQARAQALIDRRFNAVFGASLAYAMATAK